jgi:hypothetical protein
MYIDALLKISDAQALTATAVGTNVIDLSLDRSIGTGEPMGVLFTVGVAADQTTGDEDYTFDVEYAANAAQSSGAVLMGRRIFESGTPAAPAQDADLLVAGYSFVIPIPPTGLSDSDRYLGIRCTLAGTTPTITIDAQLMPLSDISKTADYASGYTIG